MDKVKNMAYWKAKNQTPEITKDSPMKFLGGLLADKVGGKLEGKGGFMGKIGGAMQGKGVAGALLNPLAAVKNKLG